MSLSTIEQLHSAEQEIARLEGVIKSQQRQVERLLDARDAEQILRRKFEKALRAHDYWWPRRRGAGGAQAIGTLACGHAGPVGAPCCQECAKDLIKAALDAPVETIGPTKLADAHPAWKIEYEIPPLRAIYTAEAGECTEEELRESIRLNQPRWKIRKLTRIA